MAEPTRVCPQCKQPRLVCRKIRIQSGANRRDFACGHCQHQVAAPTKASVIATIVAVVVGLPVLLHFHPDYALTDPAGLPTGFWIAAAVAVVYTAYVTRAMLRFEREAPVAAQ